VADTYQNGQSCSYCEGECDCTEHPCVCLDGACINDTTADGDVDNDADEEADRDVESVEAENCECSSGLCCDGCSFYGSGHVCETNVDSEYGCPTGEACGENVGIRYRDRYCSGSGTTCNGQLGTWKSWEPKDACSASEYCVPGVSTCQLADSEDYFSCDLGDVYWFNSCGIREDKKEECGYGSSSCSGDSCQSGEPWYDSSSGLTWENPLNDNNTMSWYHANNYCEGRIIDGHSDWRLPTIGELRSLIRGCEATETDGSCGVTDSCTSASCDTDSSCEGCIKNEGPVDNCYSPEGLSSCGYYWSSTRKDSSKYWGVFFSNASVIENYGSPNRVRCVR